MAARILASSGQRQRCSKIPYPAQDSPEHREPPARPTRDSPPAQTATRLDFHQKGPGVKCHQHHGVEAMPSSTGPITPKVGVTTEVGKAAGRVARGRDQRVPTITHGSSVHIHDGSTIITVSDVKISLFRHDLQSKVHGTRTLGTDRLCRLYYREPLH